MQQEQVSKKFTVFKLELANALALIRPTAPVMIPAIAQLAQASTQLDAADVQLMSRG